MKVLGLSFGKKGANCDILCKEALWGAKEAFPDAEIKFINTQRLTIDRCIGCGACSTALEKGKDNQCIVKDDFQMVEDAVREADAVIVAAPVYTLQPVGQFKNFVDRFSCRHDVSAINWVLDKRREGTAPGNADDFPIERLRRRTVSYISVGGAITDNWVSMGNCSLHLFGISAMMSVVSNYRANYMGHLGNPYLDEQLISDMHEIGKRTCAEYSKVDGVGPFEKVDVEYWNPKGMGVCPVCHQDIITLNGTTTVECPVCGIEGKLVVDGDKVSVEFSEAQQARARGTFAGLREHTTEIQGFGAVCAPKIIANKEMLDQKMKERIKDFDANINA